MSFYFFMKYPEASSKKKLFEKPLLPYRDDFDTAEKRFWYIHGKHDRNDDRLRTSKALAEKHNLSELDDGSTEFIPPYLVKVEK